MPPCRRQELDRCLIGWPPLGTRSSPSGLGAIHDRSQRLQTAYSRGPADSSPLIWRCRTVESIPVVTLHVILAVVAAAASLVVIAAAVWSALAGRRWGGLETIAGRSTAPSSRCSAACSRPVSSARSCSSPDPPGGSVALPLRPGGIDRTAGGDLDRRPGIVRRFIPVAPRCVDRGRRSGVARDRAAPVRDGLTSSRGPRAQSSGGGQPVANSRSTIPSSARPPTAVQRIAAHPGWTGARCPGADPDRHRQRDQCRRAVEVVQRIRGA